MIRLFKHYIPNAVLLPGLLVIALLVGAPEIAWQLCAQQIAMEPGYFANRWLAVVTTAPVILLQTVRVILWPEGAR
jgi:hypothetical protein